jgi:hypothetical protein
VISEIGLAARSYSLPHYYANLCRIQAEAHGEDYLLVHHEIRRCLSDCPHGIFGTYTELGVNQGATLAAAILHGCISATGYDIDLSNYRLAARILSNYATRNGVKLAVIEGNSIEVTLNPVDVLYIDSYHSEDHLRKELKLHSDQVNKYIICHDTNSSAGLRKAVRQFVRTSKWRIVNDCREGTGFTTLAR